MTRTQCLLVFILRSKRSIRFATIAFPMFTFDSKRLPCIGNLSTTLYREERRTVFWCCWNWSWTCLHGKQARYPIRLGLLGEERGEYHSELFSSLHSTVTGLKPCYVSSIYPKSLPNPFALVIQLSV